jgi:hypothetical protein
VTLGPNLKVGENEKLSFHKISVGGTDFIGPQLALRNQLSISFFDDGDRNRGIMPWSVPLPPLRLTQPGILDAQSL